MIRKFVKSMTLITDEKEEQPNEIFIVAPSVVKQIFYRELLMSEMNEYTELNPMIYHSLEELPDECLYFTQRIVYCDYTVYQCGFDTENTRVIPISLNRKYEQLNSAWPIVSNKKHL